MKTLLVLALLTLSATTQAYYSQFQDVTEEICPGMKELKNEDVLLCMDNAGASEIFAVSSKNSLKLDKLPEIVEFYNVVELNIWPDDSTSMMYMFSSILRTEAGKKIGYRVFHAYHNSEMESVIKLETRYNLEGKLVSIEIH